MKKNLITKLALLPAFLFLFSSIIYSDSTDHNLVKLKRSRVTASSKLIEKGLPRSFYNPEKAVDGNMKTSWCANAKGEAIAGQSLTIDFQPTAADGFAFFPGVGASGKWYRANNIITRAKITVTDNSGSKYDFHTGGNIADCYDPRDEEQIKKGKDVCGFSTYYTEGSYVDFKKYLCVKRVKITILAVKRGLKYDDTCISETGLRTPGGAVPPPKAFTDFRAGCR